MTNYQIRKTKKQKEAFRLWLAEHLSSCGYQLQEEKYSKSGSNLVVGDVASSEIILTAHYDTPPNFVFPLVMGFSNWLSFAISQLLSVIPLLLLSCLFGSLRAHYPHSFILPLGFLALLLLYVIQLLCGFANKHTANDNTSGIATLLSILEALPQETRKKTCVVFLTRRN